MRFFEKLCWPFWDLWFNLKYYLDSVTEIRVGQNRKCPALKQRTKAIQRKL